MGVKFAGITSPENLQKFGLQHPLSDPSTNRHTSDGPSLASIMPRYVFQFFLSQGTHERPRVVEVEKTTIDGFVIIERGATDGAVDAKDTTKGVQTKEGVGFDTPDPPSC